MPIKTEDGLRLVITQPMLMPWHGLFSQFLHADRILIYDDVQLPKGGGGSRGFMTRVQIKTLKGTEWLSIPVQRSGNGKLRICDAMVADTDWRRQHLARIEQAYRKTPFYKVVLEEVVRPVYSNSSPYLADFLIGSMEPIAAALGIAIPFERTSQGQWRDDLTGNDRVVEICKICGARFYISGNGGMAYLQYEDFESQGVRVCFMNYKVTPYPQPHGDFTPYVSALDILFSVGLDGARRHLRSAPVYWKDWPQSENGRPCVAS